MTEVDKFMVTLKNDITHAEMLHNVGIRILEHGARCLSAIAEANPRYHYDDYTLHVTSGGMPMPVVRLALSHNRGQVKVIKYGYTGKPSEEVHVINNQGVEHHIREAIINDLV